MRGRGSITFPSARPRVRARNASRDSEAASTGGRAELVPSNRREPRFAAIGGDVIPGRCRRRRPSSTGETMPRELDLATQEWIDILKAIRSWQQEQVQKVLNFELRCEVQIQIPKQHRHQQKP